MNIRLNPINAQGLPTEPMPITELAGQIGAATADLYRREGFEPPWIGYFAVCDGELVGSCGFKSPPRQGRVEIAYFTFPGYEGRGIATAMARSLVRLARETDPSLIVVAQTLPEENASTAVLTKVGLVRTGWADDDEVGKVWEWQLPRPAALRQAAEGRTVAVVGDVYRFLATGRETDGKYAQWEALVPPGGGPPPHLHRREEEGFYILEGEIVFRIGTERVVAQAGMFANMPIGTKHSFKNESDRPARMLITVAPAGLEEMFFAVGTALADGTVAALPPTKEEIEKLLSLAPTYGIEIETPGT